MQIISFCTGKANGLVDNIRRGTVFGTMSTKIQLFLSVYSSRVALHFFEPESVEVTPSSTGNGIIVSGMAFASPRVGFLLLRPAAAPFWKSWL